MSEPEYTIDLDEAMAHAPFLRRVARALVGDDETAEDVLQETWIAAIEHPPQQAGRLRAWLTTVLRSKAHNRRRAETRRAKREPQAARSEAIEGNTASHQIEVQRQVFEQVLSLSEPYRVVVHLRFYEGIGPSEIAQRLGLPVKTVKSRLHRALATLRERLDREHDGDRGVWMSGLVPFVTPRPMTLAPAPLLASSLAMKKLALVALAVIVGVVMVPRLMSWWGPMGPFTGTEEPGPAFLALSPGTPQVIGVDPGALAPRVERERMEAATAVEAPRVGSIEVSVVWEKGGPVAEIGVHAQFQGPGLARPQIRFARTDQDGIARFERIAEGEVSVQLDRESRPHKLEIEADTDARLRIELPVGIELSGRVLTPRGEPAAGAEIWIEHGRSSWPMFRPALHVDEDGHFRLRGLAARTRIGARAEGYQPSLVVEASALMESEPGKRSVELRLFEPGGRLRGRITDLEGEPVGGAIVVAGPRGGWNVDLAPGVRAVQPLPVRAAADSEGRFIYPGDLPAGATPVSVTAPGFPTWSGEVVIVEGTEKDLEVQLVPGARVEGRLRDRDGRPVAGGKVLIAEEWAGGWFRHQVPPPSTKTDEEGRFTLEGISPGAHELNASPTRAERSLGKAQWRFECSGGEQLSPELVLDVGLVIEGRVVDSNGLGVSDWMVYSRTRDFTRYDGGSMTHHHPRDAQTDRDGRFRLANLGAGGHDLSLRPPGHYGSALASVYAIQAGTVGIEITVDSDKLPNATIAGTMGTVPANAWITIRREDDGDGYFINVDPATGRFEHGPLMSGRYRITVARAQESLYIGEFFSLESGEHRDLGLIQLTPPGAIELQLTGELPDDLESLRISADRAGCSSASLRLEGGSFVSEELAEGRWLLHLWQEPYFMPDAWVDVVSGETQRVELELKRGYERDVSCRFESEDTQWKTLSVEIHDAQGALMRAFPSIERRRQRGLEVSLHSADLPNGDYALRAWTDTGLEGSGEMHYEGPSYKREEWVVELR